MARNLAIIFFSLPTSRGHPSTDPAMPLSLFSLSLSNRAMFLPQQTAAQKMADVTTESPNDFGSGLCMLKDLGLFDLLLHSHYTTKALLSHDFEVIHQHR